MNATRIKKPVGLALDSELLAEIDRWIERQEFPPTKTAVFETALREFLKKRQKRHGGKRDAD